MLLGEAAELFVALLPVHQLEQHPFWLLKADMSLQYLRGYLTRAMGRTSCRLERASKRRRNGFQGLFGASMGQEDFVLPDFLFIAV